MKQIKLSCLFVVLVLLGCTNLLMAENQELKLVYDRAATIWEETLPLGNGRIGMMPDGQIDAETIVLNDITMWSGSEDPLAFDADAIKYLPQIRQLLLAGKNHDAQNLMYQHFRCGGQGSAFGNGKDTPYGCFQMLGNLQINYQFKEQAKPANYRRTLSLDEAIASTQFTVGDTHYSREYFASHAEDVLVIRIQANKKKSISFALNLNRPERAMVSTEQNSLIMEGQLNDGNDGNQGVRFFTKLQIVNRGGKIFQTENSLLLHDADEVFIILSTSTNMLDKNYKTTVENRLANAKKNSYAQLKKAHVAAYQEKFNRVQLFLGKQDNQTPTNERLSKFQTGDDPAFAELYFQFGRYLMISGTNENSLPLNLQGLWANTVQTPWNGDYHLNINLQMNYWPLEVCNLSSLHRPFHQFVCSLVASGEKTAATYYGAEGWVAHMMSNPWQFTAPGEHASWGATNTGGAWLCAHLWNHYIYYPDIEYLRSIYPTMAGAAQFFLSSMIEEPRHGWLVTAPSSSPENAFYLADNKNPVYVCMGPTMDVQLINELFTNVLSASEILQVEDETTARIRTAIRQLPPMQISSQGYLQEWLEDYQEVEPTHRHVSHLYGLYPGNLISVHKTPLLAQAAKETLERRGDAGTGWSRAWKINFWARLQDGNRAYKLLKSLLEPAFDSNSVLNGKGGTYANLFCAHPPFQIDGNFGGTAGIAEMLVQSHDEYIHFLPALPDAWHTGSLKGLRVQGGGEIELQWEKMQIRRFSIKAVSSNTFRVKIPQYAAKIKMNGKIITSNNGFVTVRLSEGEKAVFEICTDS